MTKGANKRLGELLTQEDLISREQLEEALREKQSSGEFLGETLMRLGYITEEDLIGFLVRQCRIPHLKLASFQVSEDVCSLIPAEICQTHKVIPIDRLGNLLTIAMVNPIDVEALEKIRDNVTLKIKPILCSWSDFQILYKKAYETGAMKIRQGYGEFGTESAEEAEKSALREKTPAKTASAPKDRAEKKAEREPDETKEDGLIRRFTFDNFVVGEANSFTYAIANSIAEEPGLEYNPLFIYGNTGLGKTHLSNAIGNEILNREKGVKLVYAAATRFIDEMLDAIEHDNLKDFRERYGNVDVLIIDDVQFLSGRTRAQEEFFNIFNAIHSKKKQIILVSDVPPKDLEGLEKRLISRFEGGVVASLEEPDFETRLSILRKKAEEVGSAVPDDVLVLLAKSIKANIRELEGALKKLLAYSSLVGHDITAELAQEILKHLFKPVRARN